LLCISLVLFISFSSSCSLETLVEGLVFYFSASIRNQIIREKGFKRQSQPHPSSNHANNPDHTNNNNNNNNNQQYQSHHAQLCRTDTDYAKGCILSQRLTRIFVQELIEKQDPILFTSIANALTMHASLEMNYDMKYISEELGDRIGYQIGDKIFTYSILIAYSLLHSS
jgi:hypothetical protein